ncbi:hypothetical protein [Desulfothermobacter acidiphilus]|uniref:hypothetical protein n=1 Tax=Desulfothermobacter acidiphilus TaxID=1938353 RepID=UPI003F8A404A
MADIEQLRQTLEELKQKAVQAVDMSVELRQEDPRLQQEIARYWEDALGTIWYYLKDRSKQTKQNLLAGIRFPPRRPAK